MHKIYQIFSNLLVPFIFVNIFIRMIKNKEDKNRYKERFGITSINKNTSNKVIWLHAASVGEFKSCDFIINNYFKKNLILVTTTTKSASDYIELNYAQKVVHQYAPLDIYRWVNKFLQFWKPSLVLWIESDIWPNTLKILEKNQIKTIYLNARISPRSLMKWKLVSSFYSSLLNTFSNIFAQSIEDKKRLEELTNRKIDFIGNLKLTKKNLQIYKNNKSKKFTIMLASTHENEEFMIIANLKHLILNNKSYLFR